eukprot:10256695-Ditylum_brightwellii.AAC.1
MAQAGKDPSQVVQRPIWQGRTALFGSPHCQAVGVQRVAVELGTVSGDVQHGALHHIRNQKSRGDQEEDRAAPGPMGGGDV